jgi:hypothetical protein
MGRRLRSQIPGGFLGILVVFPHPRLPAVSRQFAKASGARNGRFLYLGLGTERTRSGGKASCSLDAFVSAWEEPMSSPMHPSLAMTPRHLNDSTIELCQGLNLRYTP